MPANTASEGATLNTTTVARVAATSGLVETEKNIEIRRTLHSTEDTDDVRPIIVPVLPTLTIITMSVPAEAIRVGNTDANTLISPYSPSELGGSPPLFSSSILAHSSHSEATTRAPPQPNTPSLMGPVEAALRRSNMLRPDPPKKYTEATMPAIYDTYPSAPLQHMDPDLVDTWENYPGNKLLAHPFDDKACSRDLDGVKFKIFSAVLEITNSQSPALSPPRPSQAAIEAGFTPTCFLIYNLTEDGRQLLLERSVWSSTNVTFHVTSFYPTCPDFLFSIKGFGTNRIEDVCHIVHSVWRDEETETFLDTIIESLPRGERANAKQAISRFIASMWVTLLPVKQSGNILAPQFNVYANGSLILRQAVWTRLKEYLANRVYASSLLGNGTTEITPFHCGICRSVDHPMGLCPFPDIKGWNGPSMRRIIENMKASRSKTRGTVRRRT
ncbi:hypothetical protein EDB87DRAFT_1682355 [Lactarius vividus]|nr:hypothetical protein EDB87DRAFT_1682355 [Lactarius vividus]